MYTKAKRKILPTLEVCSKEYRHVLFKSESTQKQIQKLYSYQKSAQQKGANFIEKRICTKEKKKTKFYSYQMSAEKKEERIF